MGYHCDWPTGRGKARRLNCGIESDRSQMAEEMNPGDSSRSFQHDRPVAVIDLETTGTNITTDRVVQVAVLKLATDGSEQEFETLVNPQIDIPAAATRVHGISNADVQGKPTFLELAPTLLGLLSGCDLVGFNLSRFDLPLLQVEFQRAGQSFTLDGRSVIDVMTIFHARERRDLSAAVKFYCGYDHKEAHSALGDVRATRDVLESQLQRYVDLPTTCEQLAAFCNEINPSTFLDSGCWFQTKNGQVVFAKGQKHNGELLLAVAAGDRPYLEWIVALDDVPSDTKEVIQKALR
jgi:DNA polymerase III subunit epsilon